MSENLKRHRGEANSHSSDKFSDHKNLNQYKPLNKNLLPTKEKFFEEFDNRIKDGGSFIFSDSLLDDSIKLKKISNAVLPEFIQKNKEQYLHMFC
jgi:hypothetical protein